MLYLSANSENVIYTEVSANKTLSNPTYLMSLTHAQTGKNWSFIPQNVSSYSGSPYNDRYDIFKFTISGGTQNLTGGTLAYYHQNTPAVVYSDSRNAGTDKWYLIMNPVLPVVGQHQLRYDFSDDNIEITGATVTLDGTSLSVTLTNETGNGQNTWLVQTSVSGGNMDLVGELEVTAETNSGTTLTKSWYVTSLTKVLDVEPWTFYGYDDKGDIIGKTLPVTHIDTPFINIDEIGEFAYSIREQSNPINLTPSLAMNKLEVGLGYITEGFTDTFYDNSESSTVYNPD